MPRIPIANHEPNPLLSLTGGIAFLLVMSSVLVLGALCKYLRKLCHKVWRKPRWKRGSKRRKSKREAKRSASVKRSHSKSSKTREGVVVSPEFSIPSSRSCVVQQPVPDLSQGRPGRTIDEKRLS